MTLMKKIYNSITDETTEIPLSKEEIDFLKTNQDEVELRLIEIANKATAKAALLVKLGITSEEAVLLLS